MSHLAPASTHLGRASPIPPSPVPVFQAEDGAESSQCWGELFSVFGDDLDATLKRFSAIPGAGEITDAFQAASRRYGALLEGLCMHSSRSGSPCLIYDCADGFAVLMVLQGKPSSDAAMRAAATFDDEETAVDEGMFGAVLSEAMRAFFDRYGVKDNLVSVELDHCEYAFMRAEHRDQVLRDLKIGTSADVF